MHPKAKKAGMSVRSLGDELVVIDRKNGVTHHLNSTVAMVWRSCDGRKSKEDLASLFARRTTLESANRLVEATLADLASAGLLVLHRSVEMANLELSRRQAIRRLAVAGLAGIALPAIATAIISSPVQAENNCPPYTHKFTAGPNADTDLLRRNIEDDIHAFLDNTKPICPGTCTDAKCVLVGLTVPETEIRKHLEYDGLWHGGYDAVCTITVRCGCRHV